MAYLTGAERQDTFNPVSYEVTILLVYALVVVVRHTTPLRRSNRMAA